MTSSLGSAAGRSRGTGVSAQVNGRERGLARNETELSTAWVTGVVQKGDLA